MSKSTEHFEKLVLDEDVPIGIGKKLEGRDVEVLVYAKSASDTELIEFAIENDAPLLTKDEDFRERNSDFEHHGILIDNQMHLRDWTLVADTVKKMLDNISKEAMKNNLWRVSDYYGVF